MYKYAIYLTTMLIHSIAFADVPTNAVKYLPMLEEEHRLIKSPVPLHILAGLIEHETCVTSKSKTCWSPKAQYKTRREQGVGFGMITRAYRVNGTVRFDTLARVRKSHKSLRSLTWENIKTKPRLQLRAMILHVNRIWESLPDRATEVDKIAMTMSAYNQGVGGLRKDIQLCKRTKNCNSNKWYGNVRDVKRSGFGTRKLGTIKRTAWSINRKHVNNTLKKARKYVIALRSFKIQGEKISKHLSPHLKLVKKVWTKRETLVINQLLNYNVKSLK